MADVNFHPFARSEIFKKANGARDAAGRLLVDINLTLRNEADPNPAATAASAALHLHLMGPNEVAGLQPPSVVATAPKHGSRDNETTKLAHVDFAEIDALWRYSPEPSVGGATPRPFLALITGTTDELKVTGGSVRIEKPEAVLGGMDLKKSAQWAHVAESAGRKVARLISPRGREPKPGGGGVVGLQPNREYVAVVVPAFVSGPGGLIDAWEVTGTILTRGPAGGILPAYFSWTYNTADSGDFETLAARLHGVEVGGLGRSMLRYNRNGVSGELEIRGAITSLAAGNNTEVRQVRGQPTTWPFDTAPAPDAVLSDVEVLTSEFEVPRAHVIGLTIYGRPWIAEPEDTDWGRLLNGDPRFRGIGGLGAWLAIQAQEELIEAARQQVGALADASQRVRFLALGLLTARSLWKRRLPADPRQQLFIFGPAMRRLTAEAGAETRPALDLVTGGTRALPRALFSTAARRMLRPGDGVAKHALPGAAGRGKLLDEANKCRPLPARSAASLDSLLEEMGLPDLRTLLEPAEMPPLVAERIREIAESGDTIQPEPHAGELSEALRAEFGPRLPDNLFELLQARLQPYEGEPATQEILEAAVCPFLLNYEGQVSGNVDALALTIAWGEQLCRPLERPCAPVSPAGLADPVAAAFSPLGPAAPALARVQATIEGLDISRLEPPEVCIGLNYEVWKLLRDQARHWLLPGVEELEKDAVVAMESNPAFIEALLAGLNTQFLGELHWRNMAIAANCTPLRWFWGNFDHASERRVDDIKGINLWQDTRLADPQHQVIPPGAQGDNRDLVLLFRTDLFRRYPHTLVYLTKMDDDNALKLEQPDFVSGAAIRPKIKGVIGDDITFFIFDVDPSKLPTLRVVLDEPPAELRFRNDKITAAETGATFAFDTIDTPTRVAIDGDYLQWKGLPA